MDRFELDQPGGWSVLGGRDAEVSGLLVGGCVEVLSPLAATPYADVPDFGRHHAGDGTLVFLEACEWGPYDVARALHAFRLAGWFEHANGVLIGRPAAPDTDVWSQHDAVADALGDLDIPVILDVDCGHVAPHLPLVTGVPTRVTVRDGSGVVRQDLSDR